MTVTYENIDFRYNPYTKQMEQAIVEADQLGTTIIEGGKILTSILDVDDIFAQNITATGTITGAILRTSANNNRAEMEASGFIVYNSTGNKAIELSPYLEGALNFYDDDFGATPTTRVASIYDISTYNVNLIGVDFSYGDIISGDIMIYPTKNIWWLQSDGTSANLRTDGTDIIFEDKAGTSTSLLPQLPVTKFFQRLASVGIGQQSFTGFGFIPTSYKIKSRRDSTSYECSSDCFTDSSGISHGVAVSPMSVTGPSQSGSTNSATRTFFTNGGGGDTRGYHYTFDTDGITLDFIVSDENSEMLITCYP